MSLTVNEIACGMLCRYRSAKVALEMAFWHAMDHAEGSAEREKWKRVSEEIAHLDKQAKERRRSP